MSFDIVFDYRFDTNGFFDNPDARAALEHAAGIWEDLIQDGFPDVPAGATFILDHPSLPDRQPSVTVESPIDDLLIFVGAQSPPFGDVQGIAAGGFAHASGTLVASRTNGDADAALDFEPAAGQMSFDPAVDWSFALDGSQGGAVDFVTVALHELGHVLGIGSAPSYQAQITAEGFAGPNALAVNGGPIPLEPDGRHIEDGFADGQAVMAPTASSTRVLPAPMDLAILADIGYELEGFRSQGGLPAIATESAETVFGTEAGDVIDALGGNDTISALGGDDLIIAGPGDDLELFGGAGADTFLVRPGDGQDRIQDFDAAQDTILVSAAFGFTSAEDVLGTVERPFSNVDRVVLDDATAIEALHPTNGDRLTAANIRIAESPADPEAEADVAKVYLGYFGRAPEPAGLAFWLGEFAAGLNEGKTREQVLDDIAEAFRLGSEAQALFPLLAPGAAAAATRSDIEAFVTAVFDNLFNRNPSPDGLAFWADDLAGRIGDDRNVGDIIVDIISGARDGVRVTPVDGTPITTTDASTIDAKVEVALAYADLFAGTDWTPEDDGEGARKVVAKVGGSAEDIATGKAWAGAYLAADLPEPSASVLTGISLDSADALV